MSDEIPGVENPFSQFIAAATFIRELHETFVGVGFADDQALELVKAMLPIMNANAA